MAPILLTSFEPQPHIAVRQDTAPDVVTITITRDSTTYTSTVTLGTDSGGATAAPTNVVATTTAASTPVQTLAPAPAKTTSDNSGVVIGAVLGTFLGLAVLIALVWKCCYDPRSVLWRPSWYDGDGSSYRTDSEGSSRSSRARVRVRRRGGDGSEWGRRDRGGHRVRRPRKAHVRRDRSVSVDVESRSRSEWTWGDEKRRRRSSGIAVRDGVPGWAFGGWGRSKRSSARRDSWEGGERVKMRFTVDD